MKSMHRNTPIRLLSLAGTLALAGLGLVAGAAQAEELAMIVGPYLQYPTQESIIMRWETNLPATSSVSWGEELPLSCTEDSSKQETYHETKLEGLKPSTPYFYQVRSEAEDGQVVESEVLTFQTAVLPDQPFGFAVLCDTQDSPDVVKRLTALAYAQRPSFTLLGGDLVSDGREKDLWVNHYFANMAELNQRVPLIPAIGNHERDADYYYEYFSLPDPEYYYAFSYGNAEFFILDSQKPFDPRGEQYQWLDRSLRRSKATWKIVMLHRPAYSSDENDYGDTYETVSRHGDRNAGKLVPLYEKHDVDIVWSGHIHSYERTWPLRKGKAVTKNGVIYMITGGGGGHLERAAPSRVWFDAKVRRGHHYCYVMVNGKTLRIEAYDLEGRMFDWVELEK